MDRNIGVGVLTFSASAQAKEMQIFPAHDFRADDGRPDDVDSWKINGEIAKNLITKLASRKNDMLIDYEHQSLRSALNGQPVIAAGWFNQMEWREGSGMWLTQVDLTNKAKTHIQQKELRYTSPVFYYDKNTGEILELLSVALTNTPAVDGMKEIAALTANHFKNINPLGEKHMSQQTDVAALNVQVTSLTSQLTALTAERDGLNVANAALTTERDGLKAKLNEVETAAATAKEEAEKKDHSNLLQTALNDGRLTPKQKAWASELSLAELSRFLESAPVIINNQLQHDKNDVATGEHGLTEVELAMCTRMQIKPEEFAKTKSELNK